MCPVCPVRVQALAEPEAQPTPRRAKPELQSAAAAWLVAAEAASVKPDAAEVRGRGRGRGRVRGRVRVRVRVRVS
jgi:hypothetical protein